MDWGGCGDWMVALSYGLYVGFPMRVNLGSGSLWMTYN